MLSLLNISQEEREREMKTENGSPDTKVIEFRESDKISYILSGKLTDIIDTKYLVFPFRLVFMFNFIHLFVCSYLQYPTSKAMTSRSSLP